MKAEEQEGTNKLGFFTKIKRGFAGMTFETAAESSGLEAVQDAESAAACEPEPAIQVSLGPSREVRPSPLPKECEEEEELVITCEGLAGPQIRRTRGHGPTITHRGFSKAQEGWLAPEVEAVSVCPTATEATEIPEATETPDVIETVRETETPQTTAPQTTDTPQLTGSPSTPEPRKLAMANNLKESLNELMQIDGATAVALVDGNSGMAMGTAGGGPLNLEVAAAGNSEVVRSKLKVMKALDLRENIEDILISLGSQYHIIRPLSKAPEVFIYLVLSRSSANLAMARFKLASVEKELQI